jgi:NADH-quinone oxidoreductase subunit N
VSNLASLRCILPELVLAGTAVGLFILAAVFHKPKKFAKILFPTLSCLGLLAALAILAVGILHRVIPGEFSPSLQRWLATHVLVCRESSQLFSGLLTTDSLATVFRALVIFATALGVFLSLGSPSLPVARRNEYYGLLMVLALGMCLLAGANHLLMIYVALETVSLISYVLAGFDDRTQRSSEAGLKYVLFGGVASGIMLFGMSLIYGLFGTLTLPDLYLVLSRDGALQPIEQWAALLGFVFVLVGFGYKIAAVPFHMWCPDVYEGAPTPFTALLSVGPKAAGFAVLLRFSSLFWQTDAGANLGSAVPWVLIVGIVSAATMTLGNFAAIPQNNLKRLLAYSSIAHAGYILMGVAVGKSDGTSAAVLYLVVYLLMNLGAFAVVSAVDRAAGSEDIKVYYGLGRKAPVLALVMAVFLFSLTGLPPTAGFIGKLYLFAALIKNGGFWFVMLAVVGIINSVVSLYFYARVLRAMYLEKPSDVSTHYSQKNPAAVLAVVLAVPVLILGIFWQPLATLASWSVGALLP